MNEIRFIDLNEENKHYYAEFRDVFEQHLLNSDFILGDAVAEFEAAFSNALGISHCISCANGTDALMIALRALNIGPGDEVIVPVQTWISSAECVTAVGAKVIFSDVNACDHTICIEDIRRKVSPKTKAVILVHLYGQPGNVTEILEFCRLKKIKLIEDCAQAHFAQFNGQNVGTFGDISTFSFFPTKIIGALGDAGCIVTDNPELAKYCRKYARHGGLVKGVHEFPGINSRMDTLQASFLNIKLKNFAEIAKERARIATYYLENIIENDFIKLPSFIEGTKHGWHLFVLRARDRSELLRCMSRENIGYHIQYPKLLTQTIAYNEPNSKYPNAEKMVSEIISIPLYVGLSKQKQDRIIKCINEFSSTRKYK